MICAFPREDAPEMVAFKEYLTTLQPLEALRIVREVSEFAYIACTDQASKAAMAALNDAKTDADLGAACGQVADLLKQCGGHVKVTPVTQSMEVE